MELQFPATSIQKYLLTIWDHLNDRNRTRMLLVEQIVLYAGLLLGIFLSSNLGPTTMNVSPLLAALAGLFVTPIFYGKLNIAPSTPFLARFTFFAQQGVIWSIVFNTVGQLLVIY